MAAAVGLVALVGLTAVVGRLVLLARARELGITSCLREVSAGVCESEVWWSYLEEVSTFDRLLTLAAIATPAVAGALAGSGLFGGELSRGTHVFALSQGVSRLGWWSRGLLVAGLPVAAAVAAVTPVVAWWSRPFVHTDPDPLSPSVFLTSGLVPAGYTVLTFCVAAAAGLLLRSTVRALVLAIAVQVVVLVLTTVWLRPAYLPPETRQVPLPSSQNGLAMSLDPPNTSNIDYGFVSARGDLVHINDVFVVSSSCTYASDQFGCFRSKGFVAYYSRFQPFSRYWPFQFIETGLLLVLATSALGAGLWGLRRRVH
jgi:hypothetical protein